MNSRQRAYLGSLANNIDPIFQIGKASLTPEIIAERTHSNVVKVIGKKMIFYRKAKKNPKIKLPE